MGSKGIGLVAAQLMIEANSRMKMVCLAFFIYTHISVRACERAGVQACERAGVRKIEF